MIKQSIRAQVTIMAGIKDLLSLFYWLDNQQQTFIDASVSSIKKGSHHSDNDENLVLSTPRRKRKVIQQFKKSRKK